MSVGWKAWPFFLQMLQQNGPKLERSRCPRRFRVRGFRISCFRRARPLRSAHTALYASPCLFFSPLSQIISQIRAVRFADFLKDDYTQKYTAKVKTKAGAVGVTSETERKGGSLLSKMAFKWAGPSGFSLDKLQMKPDGSHVMETSLKGVYPGVKFTFEGDDNSKGQLGAEVVKGGVSLTANMDVIELKEMSGSLCATKGDVSFGGSAKYDISGSSIADYSLGTSYSKGPIFASITTKKFDEANLGILYKVSSDLSVGTKTSHSMSSPLGSIECGLAYNAPLGVVKCKADSKGTLSAVLVKDIAKKVTVTPTVTFSKGKGGGSMVSSPTFGFGVVMG